MAKDAAKKSAKKAISAPEYKSEYLPLSSGVQEEPKFHFSWLSVLLAGIAFGIIAQAIHMIEAILTMQYYTDPAYFGVWSKIMMPGPGAPPATFYALSILFALISGIAYAYVYSLLHQCMKQGSVLRTGAYFGSILFMVSIPGFLSMYLLINLPPVLLTSWAVSSFIISLLGATAIVKIVG